MGERHDDLRGPRAADRATRRRRPTPRTSRPSRSTASTRRSSRTATSRTSSPTVQSRRLCPGGDPNLPPQCYGARRQIVTVVDPSNGRRSVRGKIQLPVDRLGLVRLGLGRLLLVRLVRRRRDRAGRRQRARVPPLVPDLRRHRQVRRLEQRPLRRRPLEPGRADARLDDHHDRPDGWWGNMQASATRSTRRTTSGSSRAATADQSYVRYYLDRIDLSDRATRSSRTINVPGMLVGGDANDPSILYTIDYRWDGTTAKNDFDVLKLGTAPRRCGRRARSTAGSAT